MLHQNTSAAKQNLCKRVRLFHDTVLTRLSLSCPNEMSVLREYMWRVRWLGGLEKKRIVVSHFVLHVF